MLQTKRCVTRSYLVIYCHCCGDMDIDQLQNVWPLKLCGLTVDGGFCEAGHLFMVDLVVDRL